MKHRQLAERVAFIKNNEQEERKMCKIMEDLQNEARDEAEKNAFLSNIRSLMRKMKWTAQQAMEALDVPADKQKEYSALI